MVWSSTWVDSTAAEEREVSTRESRCASRAWRTEIGRLSVTPGLSMRVRGEDERNKRVKSVHPRGVKRGKNIESKAVIAGFSWDSSYGIIINGGIRFTSIFWKYYAL